MAGFQLSFGNSPVGHLCKTLPILGLLIYLLFIFLPNYYTTSSLSDYFNKSPSTINHSSSQPKSAPTNLSHIVFGLLGSEDAWHHRKPYIESWWRPNTTRGFLYLDRAPSGDLLPWPSTSPPYRVSDDLTDFLQQTNVREPIMIRMVHGIMEVFRDITSMDGQDESFRWLVMGDDDSVFFVDNIVDVLASYDHTKFYYIGGRSEFVMSNYWYSFNQGFGGAGFVLSYPLAKVVAENMEGCLRRHAELKSADLITMVCIADYGVNLSPHKGIHQIDLRGDISGFLSSHPKSPLLSLHHLDKVDPVFPTMDRFESTRHLVKAAAADHSRLMQQTICHHRQSNWSFSVSWGYSVHIYERIMPRSHLQKPIETFRAWSETPRPPPQYMFNTRLPSHDPCEVPHVFFFGKVEKTSAGILTAYSRAALRGLPSCSWSGNHTADFVSEIRIFSPATKRNEMDRCECCDIVSVDGTKAEVKFRECLIDEVVA